MTTQLWPLIVVGIEVHEPQTETTTEYEESSVIPTTESITLPATDNGMTVPDLPVSEGIPTSSEHSIFNFKGNDDFLKPTVSSTILFNYPENHKNFTPSPYLGTLETPPILDQYNKYRQQYKEYYHQKSQYNQKPIKFEENSAKNHYVSHNLNSYLEPDHVKKIVEQIRYKHKPFPYTYDHEKLPQNSLEQASIGSTGVDSYAGLDHHFSDGQQSGEGVEDNQEVVASHKVPLAGLKLPDQNRLYGFEHHLQNHEHHEHHEHHGQSHEHHVQNHEHHVQPEHKHGHSWKKVLRMLTALVPLGLFIATLTPNILHINSTL